MLLRMGIVGPEYPTPIFLVIGGDAQGQPKTERKPMTNN